MFTQRDIVLLVALSFSWAVQGPKAAADCQGGPYTQVAFWWQLNRACQGQTSARDCCAADTGVHLIISHHHISLILDISDIALCFVLWLKTGVPMQRFNQANFLKRTIFELIAQELLETLMPESKDPSAHGNVADEKAAAG